MKRYIITALAVAAILTACNSENDHEADTTSTATITFSMTGDFQLSSHDFTRSLEADGKTMTDVWVFDYVGGVTTTSTSSPRVERVPYSTPTPTR